jgi:hypothetical protein
MGTATQYSLQFPVISALTVGILSVLHVVLTLIVGMARARSKVPFGDGGDLMLLRRIRAHANFTECVPIALAAMLTAELVGVAQWSLIAGATSLILGRIWHAQVIVRHGWSNGRGYSMLLTLAAILWLGLSALIYGMTR